MRSINHALVAVLVALTVLSALRFLLPSGQVGHVSAVTADVNVGVYWDSRCRQRMTSIDWGTLSLGNSKTVNIFLRNEGSQTCFLTMKTSNWNPSDASKLLSLSWIPSQRVVAAGAVVSITLMLHVSFQAPSFSGFSFNIVFEGSSSIPGDVNRDGYVGIDDLRSVIVHFNTEVGMPDYDPWCDVDEDGCIGISDVFVVAQNYGQEIR